MEQYIFIDGKSIYGATLKDVIVRLLVQGRVDSNIVKHYHYGEIYLITKCILDQYSGFFFNMWTLKIAILQTLEELDLRIEDFMKAEFTKSYGPEAPQLKKNF